MDYYGISPSSDFFAHYGVKGMKWGVRRALESFSSNSRNQQKAFYKSMKQDMKSAGKINRAARETKVSGAKNIGRTIPRDVIQKLQKAQNRLDNAYNAQYNFEERLYSTPNKKVSRKTADVNSKKLLRLDDNYSKAVDAYMSEMQSAKDSLLGKYGRRKIKMDSPNTRMKWDANRVLEGAIRSQLKERPISVKLTSNQKKLEAQWKKSKSIDDAEKFFNSMNSRTRKRYHDRYLY